MTTETNISADGNVVTLNTAGTYVDKNIIVTFEPEGYMKTEDYVNSDGIVNNAASLNGIAASKYALKENLNRKTSVNVADTNYTTFMARGEALLSAAPTEASTIPQGAIAWVYE